MCKMHQEKQKNSHPREKLVGIFGYVYLKSIPIIGLYSER